MIPTQIITGKYPLRIPKDVPAKVPPINIASLAGKYKGKAKMFDIEKIRDYIDYSNL